MSMRSTVVRISTLHLNRTYHGRHLGGAGWVYCELRNRATLLLETPCSVRSLIQ